MKTDLIKYRIERAKETMREAHLLAENGHWNTTLNRLYYSVFYMVSAWVIANDSNASTHNGIKTLFNAQLVRTGLIDLADGQLYNKLYGLRENADYRDFQIYDEEKVRPLIEETELLLKKIEQLIEI